MQVYCSEICHDKAWKSFHQYECGISQHLWSSGASITCQMALRTISQHPLSYFVNLKKDLDDLRQNIDYSQIDAMNIDDYRRVFVLVTHENERTFEDIFHRMTMACFLLYCIKLGGYFDGDETEDK